MRLSRYSLQKHVNSLQETNVCLKVKPKDMDLAVKPRIRKDEVQQIIDQRLAAILEKEISSPMSPKGESNSKSLGKRCVGLFKVKK